MAGFDEQFQDSTLASYPHERRGGGSQSIRMIRLDSPAHEATDPATSDLVIGLVLRGRSGAEWAWDGAKPHRTAHRRPGTLGITPMGARGRFQVDGFSSLLIIALPFEAMAKRLEPDFPLRRDLGLLHDAYTDQPLARRLCRRLWTVAENPSPLTHLAVDAVAEDLVLVVAGPPSHDPDIRPPSQLGLLDRRRIMAASEAPDVSVPDLARAVGMPVRTFRRNFTNSFGLPPHKWLMQQRIATARRLLPRKTHSLTDLALELGFATQAHFTDVFRRETGISPGRFRQQNAR